MAKKASKISPLHDNILCLPYVTEGKSTGGIIIPDAFRERLSRAKVIAVGPKITDKEGVGVGDDVLTIKGSGTLITDGGEDYLIMRYPDILAVLN